MSDVQMMWVGWYKQGTSDKVWGWFLPNAEDDGSAENQRCKPLIFGRGGEI